MPINLPGWLMATMEIISKYKLIFLVTLILLTAVVGCLVVKTVNNQGQENFSPEANNALTLPSTPNASSSDAIANNQKEINITLIINTGSSSKYEFSAPVATGTTVFSLLKKL
ncbi:MAG: hypothetical protein NTW06_01900, partial [Candidatus Falkowbacteria bacterium]|nr:hypothetical protein [Candidatus Falkowbacteria bacterium]